MIFFLSISTQFIFICLPLCSHIQHQKINNKPPTETIKNVTNKTKCQPTATMYCFFINYSCAIIRLSISLSFVVNSITCLLSICLCLLFIIRTAIYEYLYIISPINTIIFIIIIAIISIQYLFTNSCFYYSSCIFH